LKWLDIKASSIDFAKQESSSEPLKFYSIANDPLYISAFIALYRENNILSPALSSLAPKASLLTVELRTVVKKTHLPT